MSDSTTNTAAKPKHVLLADDNHAIRQMLGNILSTLGYVVAYAEDGRRALDIYMTSPDTFSLIITDICMPEMDGNELIKEIRSVDTTTPIIVITGYAQPDLIREIAQNDAMLFEKPLNFEALLTHIKSL